MGFGDFLKKAGKVAFEVGKKTGEKALEVSKEINELKENLQYASDSKLKDLIRNGNAKEKIAANSLLFKRGYSKEELERIWHNKKN